MHRPHLFMCTPFPLLSTFFFLPFSLRLLGLDQFTKENGGKETCFFGIIISLWIGTLVKCNLFYFSANVSFHFTCFLEDLVIASFFFQNTVTKTVFIFVFPSKELTRICDRLIKCEEVDPTLECE